MPQRLIAEALEVWREGERVLDALPQDSRDRAAVELAVADMRLTVTTLGVSPVSDATMADARHHVDVARYTVAVIAGRLPVGVERRSAGATAEG